MACCGLLLPPIACPTRANRQVAPILGIGELRPSAEHGSARIASRVEVSPRKIAFAAPKALPLICCQPRIRSFVVSLASVPDAVLGAVRPPAPSEGQPQESGATRNVEREAAVLDRCTQSRGFDEPKCQLPSFWHVPTATSANPAPNHKKLGRSSHDLITIALRIVPLCM